MEFVSQTSALPDSVMSVQTSLRDGNPDFGTLAPFFTVSNACPDESDEILDIRSASS